MNFKDFLIEDHTKAGFTDAEARNPDYQDPKYLVQALKNQVNNQSIDDTKFRNFVRKVLPMYQEFLDVEEVDIKDVAPRAQF